MLHARRNACNQNFTRTSGFQSLQSGAEDLNAATAQSSLGNVYENSNAHTSESLALSLHQRSPNTQPLRLPIEATGYNQESLTQCPSLPNFIQPGMETHPHGAMTAGHSDGPESAVTSRPLASAFNPAAQSALDFSTEMPYEYRWDPLYNSYALDRTLDFSGQHALSASPNAFSNPDNDLMEVDTGIGAAVLESSYDRPEPQKYRTECFWVSSKLP